MRNFRILKMRCAISRLHKFLNCVEHIHCIPIHFYAAIFFVVWKLPICHIGGCLKWNIFELVLATIQGSPLEQIHTGSLQLISVM